MGQTYYSLLLIACLHVYHAEAVGKGLQAKLRSLGLHAVI